MSDVSSYSTVDSNDSGVRSRAEREELIGSTEEGDEAHFIRVEDDDAVKEEKELQTLCGPFHYATKQYELTPYTLATYKNDWKQLIKEVLAGCTVAFAQVSESIAFAFIAGVGPLLGLHAGWIIGFFLSALGSRPAMINGATGVRAAVLKKPVEEFGISMLFYIVLLIGVFQAIASALGLARFVTMVPRTVMIGFVNGLAVILAMGQLPQFRIPHSHVYRDGDQIGWMVGVVVLTIICAVSFPYIPKVGKLIPGSLFGIIVATVVEHTVLRLGFDTQTPVISDLGKVDGGFPKLFFMDPQYEGQIPALTWEIVGKAVSPAFIAAAAGMVEAVMTMEVVNDITETDNPRPNQQLFALSIGNIMAGMLGTMGGGANMPMSVVNLNAGANGLYRISGLVAAVVILTMVLAASALIGLIPTASLVGVMVIVIFHTFEWSSLPMIISACLPQRMREHESIRIYRKIHRTDAVVIVVVTIVTVLEDLFTAVLYGVCITAFVFAWRAGNEVTVTAELFEWYDPEDPEGDEEGGTASEASAAADDEDVGAVVPAAEIADEPAGPRRKKVYTVRGSLFFASAMNFVKQFTASTDPDEVEVHFQDSEINDYTAIHSLNVVAEKYAMAEKSFKVMFLDERSLSIIHKAGTLTKFVYEVEPGSVDNVPTRLNVETARVVV